MNKPTFLIAILVAVGSGVLLPMLLLSRGAGAGGGGQRAESGLSVRANPTSSGRAPAFHLRLDADGRLRETRRCLADWASEDAGRLGSIKDDLALLCEDPAVREAVREHFARYAEASSYQAAAFADLFARVRHEDFVPLVQRLFEHSDARVRRKAVDAARTQAHPSLMSPLRKLWQVYRKRGADPQQAALARDTRSMFLTAMAATGSDRLTISIREALEAPELEIRTIAARLAADYDLVGLLPQIRALEAAEGVSRYRLSVHLSAARLGDVAADKTLRDTLATGTLLEREGILRLLEERGHVGGAAWIDAAFESLPEELVSLALEVQASLGAKDLLDRHWPSSGKAYEAALASDTLTRALALSYGADPRAEPVLQRLIAAVPTHPYLTEPLARGLGLSGRTVPTAWAMALFPYAEGLDAPILGAWLAQAPDELLDALAELARTTSDGRAFMRAVQWLGDAAEGSAGARARRRLLALREGLTATSAPRPVERATLLEQRIRLLDLELLARGDP